MRVWRPRMSRRLPGRPTARSRSAAARDGWSDLDARRAGARRNRRHHVVDGVRRRGRKDLYYRLNVFPVRLPPLRERADDIPALADYFLRASRQQARKAVLSISPEALRCLRVYPFPGNVRELENEIERAVALADDGRPIGCEHLSERLRQTAAATPLTLNEAIERLKLRMIEDALRECGSKTRAAVRLGLSRQSLQQMLRRRQP